MRLGGVHLHGLRFLLPAAVVGAIVGGLLALVDLGGSATYLVIGILGFTIVVGRILGDIRIPSGETTAPAPTPLIGPRFRHGFAVASLVVVFSLVSLESFVVYLAIPDIGRDFGASFSGLGWIVVAALIPLALVGLAGGQLNDLLGPRRVFLFGVVLLGVGSAGAGLASDLGLFLALRVVQGTGAALVMATWGRLINAIFDVRPVHLGGVMVMSTVAVVVGVIGGGSLIENLGWRALFLVNVPISLFVLALGAGTLADVERDGFRGSVDVVGTGLLSLVLLAFSLALTAGLSASLSARVSLLVLAVAAGVLLLVIEKRKVHPILYPFLLGRRSYLVSVIAVACSSLGSITLLFVFTLFFQQHLGHSPIETSLILLAWIAASFVAQSLAALAIRRWRWRWLLVLGLVLDAAGLLLIREMGADPSYLYLALGLAVAGAGGATVLIASSGVVFEALDSNMRGWGVQSLSTARALGGIVGLLLAGLVFGDMASGPISSTAPMDAVVDSFHDVLLATAAVVFAGAIVVAALLQSQVPRELGDGGVATDEEEVADSLGDRLGWL